MANVSSSNGLEKYPKLRFKGFSEPWNTVRIGDVYAERSERGAEDMELLSVTMNDGVKMRSDIEGKDNSSEDKSNYKIVRAGDMVYNSMRMWQGANGISPWDGIVSPAYTVLKPRMPISNGFFAALFKTHRLINEFRKNSQGMTSDTWNLKYPQIETIKTCIPALAEQEKIADFLMVLDQRIEKQRTLVEHLKKYKRGAITLILSNKDASWKSGRLGDFISINRGGSPRPIEAFITNDPDGVNWIKIGDVSEDSLYITQTAEKITVEGSRKSRKVFAGDLILSNSMSFGRPYIMQIEGCIHDGWLLLRDDGACFDKKYLCYYLASDEVLAQYKKYAAGSCVSNLNSELVSNVFIEFPPLEKQNEIASSLELLDERINCEIKLLEKLLLIKKGLLQSLFI